MQPVMIKIEDYLKNEIVGLLKEASSGCDDGYGGTNIVIFDDSFEEVAIDIIKMIKASFIVNNNS
jgi:hypothetical protein